MKRRFPKPGRFQTESFPLGLMPSLAGLGTSVIKFSFPVQSNEMVCPGILCVGSWSTETRVDKDGVFPHPEGGSRGRQLRFRQGGSPVGRRRKLGQARGNPLSLPAFLPMTQVFASLKMVGECGT